MGDETKDDIRYVWTRQDELILGNWFKKPKPTCSGLPQCEIGKGAHTCMLTPYGLAPQVLPKGLVPKPGDTVTLASGAGAFDALKKNSLMPGRITRFRVGSADLEWVPFELPASLNNMGELVDHLMKMDSTRYPRTLYDAPTVKTLFDYWGNSALRAELFNIDSSPYPSSYSNDPRSLPVRSGEARIRHILQKKVTVKEAPTMPIITDLQKAAREYVEGEAKPKMPHELKPQVIVIPDRSSDIERFVNELEDLTEVFHRLVEHSEQETKKRLSLLGRLGAVRCVAELSNCSEGDSITATLDKVMPKAKDLLLDRPIMLAPDLAIDNAARTRRIAPLLVSASIEDYGNQIREMLFGSTWKEAIHQWMARYLDEKDPTAAVRVMTPADELLNRLTQAMAEALRVLGEIGPRPTDPPDDDPDDLRALYDSAPEIGVKTSGQLTGASPMEIVCNVVGRATSLSQTLVGNLAGPPSLSIIFTEVYSSWKFAKLAHQAMASSAGATSVSTKEFRELADDIIQRIPDKELRDLAVEAIVDGHEPSVEKLANKVGQSKASLSQISLGWKAFAAVVAIASLACALGQADSQPMDATTQVSFGLATLGGAGSAVLGTVETILTVSAKIWGVAVAKETMDMLAKMNCFCGVLTGIAGVISGYCAFMAARKVGDILGQVAAAFTVVGSAAMTVICLVTLFSGPPGWGGRPSPSRACSSAAC
ncbi:MAG: hypothetical protein IPM79_09970 [Polyangiaceae bacterium]|nr:hypothetical protein [Polyangiaceae bacterium]